MVVTVINSFAVLVSTLSSDTKTSSVCHWRSRVRRPYRTASKSLLLDRSFRTISVITVTRSATLPSVVSYLVSLTTLFCTYSVSASITTNLRTRRSTPDGSFHISSICLTIHLKKRRGWRTLMTTITLSRELLCTLGQQSLGTTSATLRLRRVLGLNITMKE